MPDRRVDQLPDLGNLASGDYVVIHRGTEIGRARYIPPTGGGGTPTPADDFVFGTSADDTPQGSELTIAAGNGVGTIPAYAGSRYLLIARLASESDITSILFSDDSSQTNQVGIVTKWGSAIVPTGETDAYNVWVSNQALTQADDLTITVA